MGADFYVRLLFGLCCNFVSWLKPQCENGLYLGIASELDSALGLHRPCQQINQ